MKSIGTPWRRITRYPSIMRGLERRSTEASKNLKKYWCLREIISSTANLCTDQSSSNASNIWLRPWKSSSMASTSETSSKRSPIFANCSFSCTMFWLSRRFSYILWRIGLVLGISFRNITTGSAPNTSNYRSGRTLHLLSLCLSCLRFPVKNSSEGNKRENEESASKTPCKLWKCISTGESRTPKRMKMTTTSSTSITTQKSPENRFRSWNRTIGWARSKGWHRMCSRCENKKQSTREMWRTTTVSKLVSKIRKSWAKAPQSTKPFCPSKMHTKSGECHITWRGLFMLEKTTAWAMTRFSRLNLKIRRCSNWTLTSIWTSSLGPLRSRITC